MNDLRKLLDVTRAWKVPWRVVADDFSVRIKTADGAEVAEVYDDDETRLAALIVALRNAYADGTLVEAQPSADVGGIRKAIAIMRERLETQEEAFGGDVEFSNAIDCVEAEVQRLREVVDALDYHIMRHGLTVSTEAIGQPVRSLEDDERRSRDRLLDAHDKWKRAENRAALKGGDES